VGGMTSVASPRYSSKAEQQKASIARATVVHVRRGELRRQLRAGTLGLADVIADEAVGSMTAVNLLCEMECIRKRGHAPAATTERAERVLAEFRVSPYRLVRELTERQRGLIVAAVESMREAKS
jgi:acyl CoA:acetate/3-ketoacid CoA transferase alpha subunit